jgi:hypothetical protein
MGLQACTSAAAALSLVAVLIQAAPQAVLCRRFWTKPKRTRIPRASCSPQHHEGSWLRFDGDHGRSVRDTCGFQRFQRLEHPGNDFLYACHNFRNPQV